MNSLSFRRSAKLLKQADKFMKHGNEIMETYKSAPIGLSQYPKDASIKFWEGAKKYRDYLLDKPDDENAVEKLGVAISKTYHALSKCYYGGLCLYLTLRMENFLGKTLTPSNCDIWTTSNKVDFDKYFL